MSGPCTWPVSYGTCSPDGIAPEPLASLPASGVALYEGMAAEYLWRWTGKTFGLCEVTIELCRQDCLEGRSTFNGSGPSAGGFGTPWTPVIMDGLWYNVGCGMCGDKCGCGGSAPLALPGPVDSVQQILEDGIALSPDLYHVVNNALLVRTDGHAWATCGLEITYTRGLPVPQGGQVAAGVLAVEFAKAACNDATCQLPKRVQTITRQGVTVAMLDSFDDVDRGHTGIWIIDSWLASITKPPQRASVVYSPDLACHPARRRTWP